MSAEHNSSGASALFSLDVKFEKTFLKKLSILTYTVRHCCVLATVLQSIIFEMYSKRGDLRSWYLKGQYSTFEVDYARW
jgi:hypothetical protein